MIKSENLRIERVNREHICAEFTCGEDSLDKYIRERAMQDERNRVAVTYVLTAKSDRLVLGFFTISNYAIEPGILPDEVRKKLPRYPVFPATLIGRLAVSKALQGQNLGEFLLLKALEKCYGLSLTSGSYAVVVEAMNERAVRFYEVYRFLKFPDQPTKLYIPMQRVQELIGLFRT